MAAHIVSVNVGIPRTITWMGRTDTTAIWKTPLTGRITVQGVNVLGDDQADRRAHGGPVLFEIAQPRIPCWKLGARMNDPEFPRRFSLAGRPGAYLRIIGAGDLGAGDAVRVVHRPDHGVTTGAVARIYLRDGTDAEHLLRAPQLPSRWHEWAREKLASHRSAGRP